MEPLLSKINTISVKFFFIIALLVFREENASLLLRAEGIASLS